MKFCHGGVKLVKWDATLFCAKTDPCSKSGDEGVPLVSQKPNGFFIAFEYHLPMSFLFHQFFVGNGIILDRWHHWEDVVYAKHHGIGQHDSVAVVA